MQSKLLGTRRSVASALAVFALAALLASCSSESKTSVIGTYRMGERVQAGPLVYNALEAEWKTELEGGKTPQSRFLLVRVSITNGSGRQISVPSFTLEDAAGKSYPEVTEGVGSVRNWLGILRTVEPSQTEQGYAIFDAPMAAYKLVVSDAGDIGSEKYAHIEIPVHLE